MIVEMRGFAQRMIASVARTGTSASLPEVVDFQAAWNHAGPVVASVLKKLGSSRRWATLVVDGRYGPNTASALCTIICGGAIGVPPTKASGMPVWYAQNKDAVDGLGPPTPEPLTSVLNQPPPVPVDDTADATAVLNSSGSTIRNTVPVGPPPSASPPPEPVIIETRSSPISNGIIPPQTEVIGPAEGPSSADVIAQQALEIDTGYDFAGDEGSTIISARPTSRVPWLAAGIGAVGLGGLLFWWTQRKGRR